MRKLLYFAIAAAFIMSCSKTEAVYTPSAEISFMPVSKLESKAAVTGNKYTADQNFYVFANTVATSSAKYFENVEFVPMTGSGNTVANPNVTGETLQIYVGNPTQYWPSVTPLKFAGVTASGNINTDVTVGGVLYNKAVPAMNDDFTTMSISIYKQPSPTTDNAKNDLMYFFDDNGGAGYDKETTEVIPLMKHACAWLTFRVNAVSELVNDDDDDLSYWKELKVKRIYLKNLYEVGNVTISSSPEWSYTGKSATSEVDVFSATTTSKKVTTVLNDEFADVANNTIVLPQNATKLYVTYTYKSPAGGSIEEEKEIDLATYTPTWNAGIHYTYDLTVTAKEIKIAPYSADWTVYDHDAITDGNQNVPLN